MPEPPRITITAETLKNIHQSILERMFVAA